MSANPRHEQRKHLQVDALLGKLRERFDTIPDSRFGDSTISLALAASPHLTGLATLRVEGNRIGVGGEAALRQRFGPRVRLAAGPPPG